MCVISKSPSTPDPIFLYERKLIWLTFALPLELTAFPLKQSVFSKIIATKFGTLPSLTMVST